MNTTKILDHDARLAEPKGYGARCVVAYAGYSAFLPFVPLTLKLGEFPAAIIWKISSTVGLAGGFLVVVSLTIFDRKLERINVPLRAVSANGLRWQQVISP